MTRRKPLHPDEIVALLNKATHLQTKGDNVGVFLPIDVWRDLDKLVDLIPVPDSPASRREVQSDRDWGRRISEAELGMFALMSYTMENTPQPHGAPANIRFIGRVPESLHSAVLTWRDYRTGKLSEYRTFISRKESYTAKEMFANMKVFNDDPKWGESYCLDNGAEIVRIAKNFF